MSVCPHMTITHDALNLTVPALPPQSLYKWDIGPPVPSSGTIPCYWRLVVITGNVFKRVHLRVQPPLPHPLVLISGDMATKAYGWQVSGTHPAGMLFYFEQFASLL